MPRLHPYAEAHRGACSGNEEPWFYFCPRQEREARGGRPSRTTPSGYWKAAGTPGLVYAADGRPIGTKKTMVFYRGRAPAGAKTKWKLNEYKAFEDDDATAAVAAPAPPSHALQVTNSCMAPVSRQKCLLITSLSANCTL
ncbi:putative NAC domain-containing protein 61 [Zea mays]|jgi:hypothetical protein|uniref:putative NAC domain-containing protein 61 n=1 Tax=Zea mays TaxID=4577 RepID=UPI000C6C3B4A|nr:putative NAC domain-containing protein 61 [Zea mays]|eukprot:XP_023156096.1 putative NAC domain-containing protein 61 [Zea mays]